MGNRILYVQYTNPAGYPPLEHSSRILADAGWQVIFLGTGAHGADILEFPAHPNIAVHRWNFQQPGLWQKLHFLAFNDWVLITALRWKPKWIYASDPFACPIALVLQKLGFRVLYHEHDSPEGAKAENPPSSRLPAPSFFQRFLLWARKKLARCADLCVLPNEERIDVFKQQTATSRPVICVWNCPSRDEASVHPEKAGDDLILFYHGSIVPDRLPISVIYAFANLPSDVRLRIAGYETIGHPDYIRGLEELANSRELSSQFEYLGSLSRQALLPETRKAHVGLALMPIKAMDLNLKAMTGASNKPFEYMACGLALLVTDLPDWNGMFVDAGFGRSCDPSDPKSVATALQWFAEHPEETRTMGERGRRRVLADWNYEAKFEPVLKLLEGKMRDRASWPLWRRGLQVLREEGFAGAGERLARRTALLKHRWKPTSPDALYRDEFFASTRTVNRYADAFGHFLTGEYGPRSALDIGCGDGLLLAALSTRGVDAFGVDGRTAAVRAAPESIFVFKFDLAQPLILNRTFDLVLCVEVAQHLPPRFAELIVESIATHAKHRIIFSAAHPGQGGTDHLNERPVEYWLQEFRRHSFELHENETARAKDALRNAGAPVYLVQNIVVLGRPPTPVVPAYARHVGARLRLRALS